MSPAPDIEKAEIDRLIESGKCRQALAALRAYWRANMRLAAVPYVLGRFEMIKQAVPVRTCKLAILRSFTVEPVTQLLKASAAVEGIDLLVHVGGFNTYAQEMLDPKSSLYSFSPDILILAVQSRDIAPDLWNDFTAMNEAQVADAVDRAGTELKNSIDVCRSYSDCHLIVHTFETPFPPSEGVMDWQRRDGQTQAFRKINQQLQELQTRYTGLFLLDYEGLISETGKLNWHSEQNWASSRLPFSAQALPRLAEEWLRFLLPLTGRSCKALVMDLDNTLWGGVIGEDGIDGIVLGHDYPGVAFLNLQRVILDLYRRGILLAVCSKNNPADALDVLENHPAMLLRPEHFAAMRINWNSKTENLRDIANELNIGVDAIGFLDDSLAERELMRTCEPDVTVIDLPKDPADYARTLREAAVFEQLTVSVEDRSRNRYYSEQRQREKAKSDSFSLEDFYQSLSTTVEIAPATASSIDRLAQLTQKTNQFNMTSKRYSSQQIADLVANPEWNVYAIKVADRFGDNGITGVAIVHGGVPAHEIDTLLLSCRVIGRTVETAVLAYLERKARQSGAAVLAGDFISTAKNAPTKDVYRAHGFCCVTESDTRSRWEFDLATPQHIDTPPWLDVRVVEQVHT